MTAWARIVDNTAIEVTTLNPDTSFHPSLAAQFQAVPDGTMAGATRSGTTWTNPVLAPEPAPVAAPRRTKVSRVEFKQLLTSGERIAIRTARAYEGTDATALAIKASLDDLFDILEDPALTFVDLTLPSAQDGVNGLVVAGLIAAERAPIILEGWLD